MIATENEKEKKRMVKREREFLIWNEFYFQSNKQTNEWLNEIVVVVVWETFSWPTFIFITSSFSLDPLLFSVLLMKKKGVERNKADWMCVECVCSPYKFVGSSLFLNVGPFFVMCVVFLFFVCLKNERERERERENRNQSVSQIEIKENRKKKKSEGPSEIFACFIKSKK